MRDAVLIFAEGTRIRPGSLGWSPQHDDLDFIVKTALDFERKLASMLVRKDGGPVRAGRGQAHLHLARQFLSQPAWPG